MNAAASAVTAADRLGLTLFLAAAAHGLLILGVGFAPYENPAETPQALDVVLLEQHTDDAPEQADYLSNVNAAGGGNSKRPDRPRAPVSSPERTDQPGLAPAPLEAGAPRPSPPAPEPVLTRRFSKDRTATARQRTQQPDKSLPQQPDPVDYDARIASLATEIDNELSDYAQRPRKTFVTARARKSAAASYMHQWTESIEHIGNLNYPEAARREGLSGALVLVVAVRSDGSLYAVHVRASSGHPVLDAAAKRIVSLAAPFEPFPDELRRKTDILYITRTWEFTSGDRLTTH